MGRRPRYDDHILCWPRARGSTRAGAQVRFGRTPTDIAEALDGYIDDVAATVTDGERVPRMVLVKSCPHR